MDEEIRVIRVYESDAERLRQMYPQYRSDAERLHEFMLTVVSVTTLPRPVDAAAVPLVMVGKKNE